MTNAYELRKHFFLEDYNTAILREDFEAFFTKTKEKVTFTFGGWDGKSYDGESRTASVYRTADQGRQRPALHRRGSRGPRKGHRRVPQAGQLAGRRQEGLRRCRS